MEKPTKVISNDGTVWNMSFKDLCILFKAKFAWLNGAKHRVPERWLNESKD